MSRRRRRRRIRIGNQTAASARSWEVPWRFALDQGFDAFEWFPDRPPSGGGWSPQDLSRSARARIRCLARSHDLRLSLHFALSASPLRLEGRVTLEENLRLARQIGAVLLNIHLDLSGGAASFVRALRPLVSRLARAGIRLALENTVHDGPRALNETFAELRAQRLLSDGIVGFCLDVGHANLHAATRNDYLGFVDQLARDLPIIHVHLHENHGDRDSHLPVFTGPAAQDPAALAGLLRRLQSRGFSGHIILEQWPEPPELLTRARQRLRQMLDGG